MNDLKTILIIAMLTVATRVSAQTEQIDSTLQSPMEDIEVEEVIVIYRSPAEQRKLRRDVLRAYPYALRAASIIEQINNHTEDIKKKKHKKRYLKKKEEILRDEFEENLKKLTKTQGRYMVRLINRETDDTVYNIIKEYKNGLNAMFWQLIAKQFESDLKMTYQPENMESIDYEIEMIINDISPMYVQRIKGSIEIDEPTYRDFQKD